jgi:hypothetical protein
MNHWKKLSIPFNPAIHEALLQQHHAAQFLTMASSTFVPEKEDDRHNSLAYETTLNSLITLPFNGDSGMRLGLRLTDLSILFVDMEGHVVQTMRLDNRSKAEVFDALIKTMVDLDIPAEKIEENLHYSIPDQPLDNGDRFSIRDQPAFYENVVYRHNAEVALNRVTTRYKNASEPRVWPHHFDTGGLIPLSYDDQNRLSRSIGIGFAIPDSMVSEPYFYLSYWSADPLEKIDNLTPFSGQGIWKTPNWQGAVLPLSNLYRMQDSKDQLNAVNRFFDEGISRIISASNQV